MSKAKVTNPDKATRMRLAAISEDGCAGSQDEIADDFNNHRQCCQGGPGGVGEQFMYEILEETLGLHFQDESLLQMALTHRSFIYEKAGKGQQCNERLEFLGDSV